MWQSFLPLGDNTLRILPSGVKRPRVPAREGVEICVYIDWEAYPQKPAKTVIQCSVGKRKETCDSESERVSE